MPPSVDDVNEEAEVKQDSSTLPSYTKRTITTRKKSNYENYKLKTRAKLAQLQVRLNTAGDNTKLKGALKNQISSYSSRLRQRAQIEKADKMERRNALLLEVMEEVLTEEAY